MLDKLYIKFYFLLFFIFVFLLSLNKFFSEEFLYVIISIYWLLLIPLKHNFSNYFEKLLNNFCIKNLFLNNWFIILIVCILFWYLLTLNSILFVLIISYILLLSFRINSDILFSIWIWFFWFFLFNYLFSTYSYDYINYLAFSFYFIILWVLYFFIDMYLNIDSFMKKNWSQIIKILINLFLLLFIISIYFIKVFYFLPYISFIILLFFSLYDTIRLDMDSKNEYYKKDLLIFWYFIIIFIPLINDYFILLEKNKILLLTILCFIFIYVWFNTKINKYIKII